MIKLGDGRYMPQTAEELPDFRHVNRLYCDVETNSYDPSRPGDYPWWGDRICGVAVTADDCSEAYYVPVRHNTGEHYNFDVQTFQRWYRDLLETAHDWVNHNIIFDAVFSHFEGIEFGGRLVDTLSLSKLHDTDRFGGHGLKELCQDWLNLPIWEEHVKTWLAESRSKNHADVPPDIEGLYACNDVLGNRKLFQYLDERRDEDTSRIWELEIPLTPVLYDMEIEGLKVNERELKQEKMTCLRRTIEAAEKIENLTGVTFTNHINKKYDILINQCGLPVLVTKKDKDRNGYWYDTGRPSFDKEAMQLYRVHPKVQSDPKIQEIIEAISTYTTEEHFNGLFPSAYLDLMDENGFIHPSYNQIVRTGRMSCKRPNGQQLNKRAKKLIHPDNEHQEFLSFDYSQIEFRLIMHYIQDRAGIEAYSNDPDTDFHQWVADQFVTDPKKRKPFRSPSKRLNFAMSYGAGKKRVMSQLSTDPTIMELVSQEIKQMDLSPDEQTRMYDELCEKRASEFYEMYHERFPSLRKTAEKAESICKRRGYVKNAYGRRRYLPKKQARKAFNTVIQGCAMDVMKDRMIALSPRYNKKSRDLMIKLAANVHDEVLLKAPIGLHQDKEAMQYLTDTLESPTVNFRVPIRTDFAHSAKTWADAD